MEITIEIVLLAARSTLQDSAPRGPPQDVEGNEAAPESSQPAPFEQLLNLASVSVATYEAVFCSMILPDVALYGLTQIEAFAEALNRSKKLRHLVRDKTMRLCLLQGPRKTFRSNGNGASSVTKSDRPLPPRASLYDALISEQNFEKGINSPLRSLLLPLTLNLHTLHLESLPSTLVPPKVANIAAGPSYRLREISFNLTTWGGVGVENVFVGASTTKGASSGDSTAPEMYRSPSLPFSPWGKLQRLQIHGRAGFRFSLASASALGSLPSLQHLGLVMPNFMRDAGMTSSQAANGEIIAPACLQLLVLLLADRLKTLLVVGHDMGGWLGYAAGYRAWLKSLRLPALTHSDEAITDTSNCAKVDPARLQIQLVTARFWPAEVLDEDQPWDPQPLNLLTNSSAVIPQHPNFVSQWMARRAVQGTQWAWADEDVPRVKSPAGWQTLAEEDGADKEMRMRWKLEQWMVPRAPESQGVSDVESSLPGRHAREEVFEREAAQSHDVTSADDGSEDYAYDLD